MSNNDPFQHIHNAEIAICEVDPTDEKDPIELYVLVNLIYTNKVNIISKRDNQNFNQLGFFRHGMSGRFTPDRYRYDKEIFDGIYYSKVDKYSDTLVEKTPWKNVRYSENTSFENFQKQYPTIEFVTETDTDAPRLAGLYYLVLSFYCTTPNVVMPNRECVFIGLWCPLDECWKIYDNLISSWVAIEWETISYGFEKRASEHLEFNFIEVTEYSKILTVDDSMFDRLSGKKDLVDVTVQY